MDPITVTQLNSRIKDLLNTAPELNGIWVSGEISRPSFPASGHCYFTLKDSGSAVDCVMYRFDLQRQDIRPRDGMKVLVYGSMDIYTVSGRVQLKAKVIRESGVGDLYLEFEKLKKKLEAEGLFDKSRKRKLPVYPRTIGVVTSATGAVIHDIITTSASRFPADIVLAPSMVQGEGAAKTIVAGIELLNRYGVDVIIVARGGGSFEDLWCFNEEIVARAIAASRIPVVSAVGHETDFTISDFVADARAPTPTGAAAIILRDVDEVRRDIVNLMTRAERALEMRLTDMRNRFDVLDARLSPERAMDDIQYKLMHLDDLTMRSDNALKDTVSEMRRRYDLVDAKLSPSKALQDIRQLSEDVDNDIERVRMMAVRKLENSFSRINEVGERPDRAAVQSFKERSKDLDALSQHLEGMNPRNVLGRGYSMVTSETGEVLKSVSSMSEGDILRIHMRDGTAVTEVKQKELRK